MALNKYYEKWKKPGAKDCPWSDSVYMNIHKDKLIEIERKQIRGYLGPEVGASTDYKLVGGPLVDDGNGLKLDCSDDCTIL